VRRKRRTLSISPQLARCYSNSAHQSAQKMAMWMRLQTRGPRKSPAKKNGLDTETSNPVHREPKFLVRLAGIEPTTPWFVAKYSIQLSYSREAANCSTAKTTRWPLSQARRHSTGLSATRGTAERAAGMLLRRGIGFTEMVGRVRNLNQRPKDSGLRRGFPIPWTDLTTLAADCSARSGRRALWGCVSDWLLTP